MLETIGFVSMWLNSQSQDWVANRNFFRIRLMLMGQKNGDQLPRYLSIPFLGYIPYPGYAKFDSIQHNSDGYRGEKIPLIKGHNLRVLCLGGSTTYGFGVNYSAETYPAQLEAMVNTAILNDSILSDVYEGCEIINAGIEAGTSAEELQQYHFKYRYYKPDIVIVHSGVNDAELMSKNTTHLQLDYTDYRRLVFNLEPLSIPARWFMKSHFFSFIAIRLFYENFYYSGVNDRECYTRQRGQTYCKWTTINMDSVFKNEIYDYHPFYQNTKSLFEEISKDSAILMVLPNILNIEDNHVKASKNYFNYCVANKKISEILAQKSGGIVIPFSFHSIDNPSDWIDDCHLNSSGERNKAKIIVPLLIKTVRDKQPLPIN